MLKIRNFKLILLKEAFINYFCVNHIINYLHNDPSNLNQSNDFMIANVIVIMLQ